MSDNKFLEQIVLSMSEKMDQGFNSMRDDIAVVKEKVIKLEDSLVAHANEDSKIKQDVEVLEKRVDKVEVPLEWGSITIKLVLIISSVVGAILGLLKIFS